MIEQANRELEQNSKLLIQSDAFEDVTARLSEVLRLAVAKTSFLLGDLTPFEPKIIYEDELNARAAIKAFKDFYAKEIAPKLDEMLTILDKERKIVEGQGQR